MRLGGWCRSVGELSSRHSEQCEALPLDNFQCGLRAWRKTEPKEKALFIYTMGSRAIHIQNEFVAASFKNIQPLLR